MFGKIRMKKIYIHCVAGVTSIKNKIRENYLRWFDHFRCKPINTPIRRVEKINIEQSKKLRERPKITWIEAVTKNIELLDLKERLLAIRSIWKKRIRILNQI